MYTWNTFTAHLRAQFGQRVQKIPLDAGASCPNRDGTLSRAGCTFCNAVGSGSGLGLAGMAIPDQWTHWREHFHKSGRATLFMAYLQSFSNTYGPAERLSALLDILETLPDLVAISVGTRPDCLDAHKAALLAERPWHEKWLELGVQTMHDRTLSRINRGHSAADSARAIELCADAGLSVCAHLMIGLPGETLSDILATVDQLNALPIHGVKLHNVYICKNTALAQEYAAGTITVLDEKTYIAWVVEVLMRLRPDIIVHRVVSDPAPGELIAPDWATRKGDLVRFIQHAYHRRKLIEMQG